MKTKILATPLSFAMFAFKLASALLFCSQTHAQDLRVHVDATNIEQKLFSVEQSFKLSPD
jgi:sensor domain CHASE-containing protein